MNILKPFAVAVLFAVGVFGDGHGDAPELKVHVELENAMFKFQASISQEFPNAGVPSKAKNSVTLMKAAAMQADLNDVRAYAVWSEIKNCSMFDATMMEHIYNMTSDIVMGNATRPTMNESMAGMFLIEGEPYIFPVIYSTIVLQVNGMNYCLKPKVEEENMQKITLSFPACSDFTPKALRENIHEIFDIDMKRVYVGMIKHEEGCMHVNVYFQYVFDNRTLLYKMKEKLTSKFGLGRFSPSEKCKTNLRETFLADKALQMCFSTMMDTKKDETANLPACTKMSSKVQLEYNRRIMKYDCLVEEYAKKYGIKIEGCMKATQQKQQADQSCACASSAEAIVQKQYATLMTYVKAPLVSADLTAKKAELTKMMSMQMFDKEKFEKLTEDIKKLEMQQAEFYFKTYFGLCVVAGHGDGALAKLNYVKEQVAAGLNEDQIVGNVVKEAGKYYLSPQAQSKMASLAKSDKKELVKKKLMNLLGIYNGYSTKEDMKRVWDTLMDLGMKIEEYVDAFNKILDNELITNATGEIVKLVKANPEEAVKMIFLHMYSPMVIPDDNKLAMAIVRAFEVVDEQKMTISDKVIAWMNDAELMELIGALIILMPPEDTKKECDLSGLVMQVQPYVDDMSRMNQDPSRRYGNQYYGQSMQSQGYNRDRAQGQGYNRGYNYEAPYY